MDYTIIIGLEVHVQLLTESKMFSACGTEFGLSPNTQTDPVSLGLPGTLPVMNGKAFELALKTAVALNAEISGFTKWDRKNYYYPDLPKNYQISQYDLPFSRHGWVEVPVQKDGTGGSRVNLTRVHLEEDTGKLTHGIGGFSEVDLNRAGIPLLEIVTEPDLRSPQDAKACLEELRLTLRYLGVSDCEMQEGSLRCDANVSVRRSGTTPFGVKTEIKNLNSFRHVQRALEYEIDRQVAVLERGGRVEHETRLWDPAVGRTLSMRSKEDAHDYRYFPEPDLPPVLVETAWIDAIRAALPELPDARRRRFIAQYGLSEYDAALLTQSAATAAYFEATAADAGNAKAASNWIMGELTRKMNELGVAIDSVPIPPAALAGLIRLVDSGTISGPTAKDVFEKMYGSGRSAADIVAAEGLGRIDDEGAVEASVRTVLAANADAVAQYRAGKRQTFGYLVGQVIKSMSGKANPALVNTIVRRELDREPA